MKRTRCISALPQTVYNPKYRPDPRQVVDPSLYKVVLRRQWVPKKWLVGEDPWEMDLNATKSFSKRNLADEYSNKIRSCLGFAEAVPYYLELKERGIPPTTTFMNLYLAAAQRYKFITDTKGRRGDVWHIFQELVSLGAKPDINTLDLLRNTLHSLCYEYCESVSEEIVQDPHARVTASIHKALMKASELSPEEVQAFLQTWETSNENSELMRSKSQHTEGYDILQLFSSGSGTDEHLPKVMEICKRFLTSEKDRKAATTMMENHELSLTNNEKGKRLGRETLWSVEQRELDADMEKAKCVQDIVALLPEDKFEQLVKHVFTVDLTDAEVVTGSVPRSTKSGKAITELKVPLWEGKILVQDEFKKARGLIRNIRQHLVNQYNALCVEQLHRQGQASDSNRVDPQVGQEIIEEVLKRYRSSLRAMMLLRIYEADRIAPLRPEIISHVSLPIELSDHSDSPDDVVTGCHLEVDRSLSPEQRAGLTPQTASIGLSYYQPSNMVRGGQRYTFDLMDYCKQHDLFDNEVGGRQDRTILRRKKLNMTNNLRYLRQEAHRRDPAIQRVFTTCIERIIERGAADIASEEVYKISELALKQCNLWPSSSLNNMILTCSSTAGKSPTSRLGLAPMVYHSVKRFDDLVSQLRRELGLVGTTKGKRVPLKTHLLKHPVLAYSDSGVDKEFFGLYLLSKPWEHEDGSLSDSEEVFRVFERERQYALLKWEESVGVPRDESGVFIDHNGQEVVLTPGDVPELAARWEDRLRNLTCSHHTYDAIFQVMYDEVVMAEKKTGTSGAKDLDKYKLSKLINQVVRQMESYQVEPGSTTFSLLLGLARRYPNELEGLEATILKKMKAAGKQHWWQWFEEV